MSMHGATIAQVAFSELPQISMGGTNQPKTNQPKTNQPKKSVR